VAASRLYSLFYLCDTGRHTEVVKLLLHYGANIDSKTINGMKPIDFADYDSECWRIMNMAEYGILPESPPLEDVVPMIPWYALPTAADTDDSSKKSKKKGQKDDRKKTRKTTK